MSRKHREVSFVETYHLNTMRELAGDSTPEAEAARVRIRALLVRIHTDLDLSERVS